MDEKVEKAFGVANYMATLASRRRTGAEEFQQKLIYYSNGGTFKISPELITFVKITLELGHDSNIPFLDSNNVPIIIPDVQQFLDNIVSEYFSALNSFAALCTDLATKRKVESLVEL